MSTTSETGASSSELFTRLQTFLAENKRAVLIGTAATVVAIGGVAYYASTSRIIRDDDIDSEKGEKRKDKKKSKGKKKKSVKDKDGPLLEERKPKAGESKTSNCPRWKSKPYQWRQERTKIAADLKASGNSAYSQRKFTEAADLYTRAIEVSPKPEAVFYSNRAACADFVLSTACYVNMSPPKHDLVVENCDEALKLDIMYVKALNRRAAALEALGRYQESLRDFTASTILDKFKNETAAQSVERVLKKMSTAEAQEILKTREPRLPSHTFISSYFAAFRTRPPLAPPESSTTGDNTLLLALDALEATDYVHAMTLANESLVQGISWDAGRAEAFNLRGTFKFLVGDSAGAKEDLEKSLEILPSFTQSWVKIASVHMEQGDAARAFAAFETAISHNPWDPDIFYHRGQVYFIMGQFNEAADNYTKSTALDDMFVFSHIQLAVAQYKSDNIANSMATFRRTMKKFPQRSEPQNYYGELLLDQQRFQDAVDKFERAIELEKAKRPPMNVLPLVNKGLAFYQWKQDSVVAETLCREALVIDPECEAAVATLAQLSLQQGKIDAAVEMFSRHADLARTEPELVNALTYKHASRAQVEFMRNYPTLAGQLGQLARSMM
ncbi:ADP/ATP carrier receptor [Gautieria morchelliformis]|nr:ADP/ATP carrier receptor [Gautieria morchelliformis]